MKVRILAVVRMNKMNETMVVAYRQPKASTQNTPEGSWGCGIGQDRRPGVSGTLQASKAKTPTWSDGQFQSSRF